MHFDEYTNHFDDINESVYSLHGGGQTSSYYIPAQTIVHESYNSDELTTLNHDRPHAVYIAEDDINNMSYNGNNNAFEMINL
ncbi:hypothetical protein MN116_006293 [Schistosoma mekongi]|uniref:Uncharacterized protein n=1 Tax=Schistosoma mekongi TaxID=38744 RepID=A0AAE2D494_SCHME|nr:hypothetical protein MN116_006293 [Schistosoma mekongi]